MTKQRLQISGTLSLPMSLVTSTQAILAQKGKGKSYAASVIAEELLAAGQQVVVIDPTDAWFGLRSSADGKSVGYPIAVFGGDHGDVPLEPTAGALLAQAIATDHFSAIICTDTLTKGEELRFMAAFLETLYRKNREAMHLIVDEADVFAPQRPFGEEMKTLGAMDSIVRRGRKKGIGCTLITQRPAVLSKNVLSQADILIALGMNHPADLAQVMEWVRVQADAQMAKDMLASLPSLPVGTAWVWAPAIKLLERVEIRARRTFDSGATPKPGERKREPKVLAPVEIALLGAAIAATAEQAKANDPKALRARVAELEVQLKNVARADDGKAAAKAETLERELAALRHAQEVVGARLTAQLDKLATRLSGIAEDLSGAAVDLDLLSGTLAAKPNGRSAPAGRDVPREPAAIDPMALVPPLKPRKASSWSSATAYAIGDQLDAGDGASSVIRSTRRRRRNGEDVILETLIQYERGLRPEQITVITGYKRSSRNTYVQRLLARGHVARAGELLVATDAGRALFPDVRPRPNGAELRQQALDRIPVGERVLLQALLDAWPEARARDELLPGTYKPSSRNTYLQRLAARELVDVDGATVRASPTLFGGSDGR